MIAEAPSSIEQKQKTGMVHYELEETPGVAWCGAPLAGHYVEGAEAECVVCADLWEAECVA